MLLLQSCRAISDSRGTIRDATWSANVHDLHADFCAYAVPVSVKPR